MTTRVLPFHAQIAFMTVGVAVVGAATFALSPLLPDIAAAFGIPVSSAASINAAFSVSLAVVAPVVGLASQRLSRARVIVGGLAVFALAWGASIFVEGFEALLALTAIAGAGAGAALPATYAYAADLAPPAQRARVMGWIVSGWSLAILVVVPMMAMAAQHAGWRWSFGILAVTGLLVAAGIALLARPGSPAPAKLGRVRPLADLAQVLMHRPTLAVLAVYLLDMGAFYAVYAFAGAELRAANDWGASGAGWVLACYGIGLAIASLGARLVDRWGRARSGIAALLALAPVLGGLPWLTSAPAAMAVAVVVWGCVQGVFFTALTTLATEQIPQMRGVVTALLSSASYLGVTLFMPAATALHAGLGYAAVGVAGAVACLAAAALLAVMASRVEAFPRSR